MPHCESQALKLHQHDKTPVICRLRQSWGTLPDGVDPPKPLDAVMLFCRLPDEPYVCCGRLKLAGYDVQQKPLRFLWMLEDLDAVRKEEAAGHLLDTATQPESKKH